MRTSRVLAPLLLSTLALTGCGGSTSADEYHRAMDKACADLAAYNKALPQKMADDDLSIEEATELSQKRGEKFLGQVEDMAVPDDLSSAHADLLDELRKVDEGKTFETADEAIAYYDKLVKAYERTGSTGCADSIRDATKGLREQAQQ